MSEELTVGADAADGPAGEQGVPGDVGVAGQNLPWYGTLDESTLPHQKLYDQFTGMNPALKALANTKAALSRKMDGHVKIPTADSSPEEISAYREAMGIPETVDGYEFQLPEKLQGLEWDPDALNPFKEIFYNRNGDPALFSEIVAKQAEIENSQLEAQQAAIQASSEALANEWGDDYEYKVGDIAARVDGTLDLSQPYMSREDVLRALDSLATDFREDNTGAGKPSVSGMSLNDQIDKIRTSEEYRNTMNPRHKESRENLHRLYKEQEIRERATAR